MAEAEHPAQQLLNELFSWLAVQEHRFDAEGEFNITELEERLQSLASLVNHHKNFPSLSQECEKLYQHLNHLQQKINRKKAEIADNIKRLNLQNKGITRYLQAAHWHKE